MDMYTDENGFKCQEFLQDLKVGTYYISFPHFLHFCSLSAHLWNHVVFKIKITVTSVMTDRVD